MNEFIDFLSPSGHLVSWITSWSSNPDIRNNRHHKTRTRRCPGRWLLFIFVVSQSSHLSRLPSCFALISSGSGLQWNHAMGAGFGCGLWVCSTLRVNPADTGWNQIPLGRKADEQRSLGGFIALGKYNWCVITWISATAVYKLVSVLLSIIVSQILDSMSISKSTGGWLNRYQYKPVTRDELPRRRYH